jgi:hypothetical protein
MTRASLLPSAAFCFGREVLVENLRSALERSAAALLFGGRMAGKTTTLLSFCSTQQESASVKAFTSLDLPVYVNLMRLGPEDGPSQFWRLLSNRLAAVCTESIEGFVDPLQGDECEASSLAQFESDFVRIRGAAGEVDVRATFLIDETKRMFGSHFPHGLQDNLFTMLFGSEGPIAGLIAMVFAGAQDLYEVFVDGTSPIGSRASQHFLANLDVRSVTALVAAEMPGATTESAELLATMIFEQTSGHAGMSRLLAADCDELLQCPDLPAMQDTVHRYSMRQMRLMEVWNASFSAEAAALRDRLAQVETLDLHTAAAALAERQCNRFLAKRAFEELSFTGIAIDSGITLTAVNRAFWSYLALFGSVDSQAGAPNDLWKLIECAEVELRHHVKGRYMKQWPNNWMARMEQGLGATSWAKILDNHEKKKKQYPYAAEKVERDIMASMYMGQLLTLMEHSSAWQMFSDMFRDKRHAQDLFGAIIPVRNDGAHFEAAPDKELARCRIACDDLIVILSRAEYLAE